MALKATDPNLTLSRRVTLAAAAMRCSESTIQRHIDDSPELSAAYGTTGKKRPASVPMAPSQTEILNREPDDLPPGVGSDTKAAVEIVQMVNDAERELHLKGLEALEVNADTIKKLRNLKGMASNTGAFIAIGLETTHRLYYLSIVELKTVADQIKTRYLDDINGCTNEERPFYYRNYIDAVKEFGRAYDLFIQGAAVILKIVSGQNDDQPKNGKPKLGFSGRSTRHAMPLKIATPPVPPNG